MHGGLNNPTSGTVTPLFPNNTDLVTFLDDFHGSAPDGSADVLQWRADNVGGTGGSASNPTGENNKNGVLLLTVNLGSTLQYIQPQNEWSPDEASPNDLVIQSRFKLDSLADTELYIGAFDNNVDTIAIYYDIDNGDGKWWFYTETTGGATTEATTVDADTNWHTVKMTSNSTSAKLYLDDVLIKTHTTNLPALNLAAWIQLKNQAVAGNKTVNIDYMYLTQVRT